MTIHDRLGNRFQIRIVSRIVGVSAQVNTVNGIQPYKSAQVYEDAAGVTFGIHEDSVISVAGEEIDIREVARLEQVTQLQCALAIDEARLGSEHPKVARDLNNLTRLLQDTNRLKEAEPLMRRALAIDEASYGSEHPEVAKDLNNLSQLLKATNRPNEAEPLMRRALAIFEASAGSEHPYVATKLNNLAQLL
ncbi:MAG: tetratricopeptide repeat protein, partial [Pseudomonadales bacterium]